MRVAIKVDGWDGHGEVVVRISLEGGAQTLDDGAAVTGEKTDAGLDAGPAPADAEAGAGSALTPATAEEPGPAAEAAPEVIDAGPAPELDDGR